MAKSTTSSRSAKQRTQRKKQTKAVTKKAAEPPVMAFVGETGPGAVINQYLPQPGHHLGRRIIKIEDTPDSYWLDESSSFGKAWNEYLGLDKGDDGVWEIRDPELLTSVWFNERARRQPASLAPAIRQVQVEIAAGAQDVLATTGSLRNWAQGRAGIWPGSGGRSGSSTAMMRGSGLPDPRDPGPQPGVVTPDIREENLPEPPPRHYQEQEEASGAFQASLTKLEKGVLSLPTHTWGGGTTEVDVDVEAEPDPTLFLIQVVGISSFLGDYGEGRTVKTFTLLPGETTTISTRTWRATQESIEKASSIIDSYDESSSERFADTVMSETTDTATRDKTENWHVEAEVKGSIGIVGGSVSGGGGGEYSSSTEEFSKAVDESVAEHAAEASSHRENSVTSSSESSVSTEDEEVVERTIKNINVSRTLNFTFRELNQAYTTKIHFQDLKIAFSNGNALSWREEPISNMRKLIEEVIQPQYVDQVCSDIIKTIAVVRDVNGTPVPVLEQVRMDKCAINYRVTDAKPNENCDYPAPTADGRLYYRFKRGPLAQGPNEEHPVEGVLMKERQIMLGSDSVVAEALLGVENALDDYSEQLQQETIRGQRLASDREALAQEIVASGDAAKAEIYAKVFGPLAVEEEEETA